MNWQFIRQELGVLCVFAALPLVAAIVLRDLHPLDHPWCFAGVVALVLAGLALSKGEL